MRLRPALIACIVLATSTLPASAAATPEGARKIAEAIQVYLGKEPGVVTVSPDGERYTLRLDAGPLIAKIPAQGMTVEFAPVEMSLLEKGGGQWEVKQDGPLSFAFRFPPAVELAITVGRINGTGIFDEALGGFASSSTDVENLAVLEKIADPRAGMTDISYRIGRMHYESRLAAGADGGADGNAKLDMSDLTETFTLPNVPGPFTVAIAKGTQEVKMTGLRSRATLDLLAWFVAHPSPEAIAADQAALKEKLRAALPLWASIGGTGTLDGMTIATMVGRFGVETVTFGVEMNGVVERGYFRESFALKGIAPPPGIVPPWAAGLVPNAMTIDFSVSDFNLAAPAALVLDNLDLAAKPPIKDELEGPLLQALLPKGGVTLTLGPSGLVSQLLDVAMAGSMTAGPASMPSGQATVSAKGFDAAMAALQAAPPEMAQQAMGALIAAKGLAKQGADGALEWKIESTPAGSVTINGIDPSKMQ